MTNNDYIQKTLSMFGISQDTIDIILADAGLGSNAECDITACKIAIFRDFHFVRIAANRNVSEGGFSLSWNDCEKALQDLEKSLSEALPDDDSLGGFGCIDRSYLW